MVHTYVTMRVTFLSFNSAGNNKYCPLQLQLKRAGNSEGESTAHVYLSHQGGRKYERECFHEYKM